VRRLVVSFVIRTTDVETTSPANWCDDCVSNYFRVRAAQCQLALYAKLTFARVQAQ
jgi:hypothetical protein